MISAHGWLSLVRVRSRLNKLNKKSDMCAGEDAAAQKRHKIAFNWIGHTRHLFIVKNGKLWQ